MKLLVRLKNIAPWRGAGVQMKGGISRNRESEFPNRRVVPKESLMQQKEGRGSRLVRASLKRQKEDGIKDKSLEFGTWGKEKMRQAKEKFRKTKGGEAQAERRKEGRNKKTSLHKKRAKM